MRVNRVENQFYKHSKRGNIWKTKMKQSKMKLF